MDKTTFTNVVKKAFRIADELVEFVETVPESAWPGDGPITVAASGFDSATLTVPAISGAVQLSIECAGQGYVPELLNPLQAALEWVGGLPRL